MNKAKRKRLDSLRGEIEQVREDLAGTDTVDIETASATLTDLRDQVDDVKCEEEEVRDNYPENLQSSDIYATMCEAVDTMDNSIMSLESAIDSLGEDCPDVEAAVNALDEAISNLEDI